MRGLHAFTGREPNRMRILKHGAAFDDLDPGPVEVCRVGRLEPRDLLVLVGDEGWPIERHGRQRPAESSRILEFVSEARRVDQQLLRNAAANDARAADPVLLRDHDPGAIAGGDARGAYAARAAADNEKIDLAVG